MFLGADPIIRHPTTIFEISHLSEDSYQRRGRQDQEGISGSVLFFIRSSNCLASTPTFCQTMDSHQLIDAQFDRAVEIVQSLPKNGPIQTDYEEKLAMYRCIARCFHVHFVL